MRSIGGSVGTTIYTAILLNYVKGNEVKALTEAVLAAKLPSSSLPSFLAAFFATNSATALEKVPGLTPTVLAAAAQSVTEVYTLAFRRCYLIAIAFGVLAVCAAASTKSVDKFMTNKVNATLDKPHLVGKGDGAAHVNRTKEEIRELTEKV